MKSLQKLLKNNKDLGHQYIDFMQLFEKKLKSCIINHNSRKNILAQYKQQQYIHQPMPFFESEELIVYGSFENSNIHGCCQEEKGVLNVLLSSDTNTQGCTQWFYFGVKIHNQGKLKIRILNNRRQNTLFKDCNHVYVYDDDKWTVGQTKEMYYYRTNINHPFYHHEDAGIAQLQQNFSLYTLEFTYEFKQTEKIVFFALTRPYPIKKLQRFIDQCPLQRKSVCITTLGLPIWQLKTPKQNGQQIVVILARQHPSETAGSFICQEILRILCKGHACMKKYRFIIYPMLNPDGVFLGNSRCNFNGIDLNRKWDNPKQKTEPEVHYVIKSIQKYTNIAFMLDLHGHSKKFNQFLYGCLHGKSVSEYMKIRQFGKILAQHNEIFQFKRDCSYGVSPDRFGTARVALWKRLNITNSMTIETSIYGQMGRAFSLEDYHSLAQNILHALDVFNEQIDSPELNINREMSKALKYDSGSDSEAEQDLIIPRPNRIKITSRKESSCKHQSVGYGCIKPKIDTPQLIHQHSQFFKDQSFVELQPQPSKLLSINSNKVQLQKIRSRMNSFQSQYIEEQPKLGTMISALQVKQLFK
ncbi:unnamed protein product [Paramecium sonneborni]|uniref:Peptidase M14 domain-containing protein n=1 Tax=Paramecium sonneborni TaxID=65129 RepID=A0A8S1LE79_9CILI|nr:unnamed protein product [Paramecium sonneborni]